MKLRRGNVYSVDSKAKVDAKRYQVEDGDQTILAYAQARRLIVDCGLD
jgi:hypothetical protein